MTNTINLAEKFALIDSHWEPRIAAELNGQYVKLAKAKGAFVWHEHSDEDEMFLVHRGELVIRMRDREVTVGAGEFFVVPRGVEHAPYAAEETEIVLFEPKATAHTGEVQSDRTVMNQDWI